jgi:hypothetical protein
VSEEERERYLKRRNRHISLTFGTAVAIVMLVLGIMGIGVTFIWQLDVRLHDIQAQTNCRTDEANDERHATLDLLVATGTLFTVIGADPTTKAGALADYQLAVDKAREVQRRDINVICPN